LRYANLRFIEVFIHKINIEPVIFIAGANRNGGVGAFPVFRISYMLFALYTHIFIVVFISGAAIQRSKRGYLRF